MSEKKLTFARMDDHRGRALKFGFNPDTDRVIILSDAHKWDRGATDFFQPMEAIYCGALNYYAIRGYTLILAGDIEEGAGDILSHAVSNYPNTFLQEKRFLPGRYFRIYGNHDHDWKKDDVRRASLEVAVGAPVPMFPAVQLGEKILVVHGHEGDVFSDELHEFSEVVLRFFKRAFEVLTFKKARAAENYRIRNRRAQYLYEWARQNRMIVIAGHTHLAYFASTSVTRLLARRIQELEKLIGEDPKAKENTGRIAELSRARKSREVQDRFWKRMESLPEDALPLYFNTGSCRYKDGLTGIEIDAGQVALVKWSSSGNGNLFRTPLASRRLADILPRD